MELLEMGRSVLWSRQLSQRPDLSRLEAAAPGLAQRLLDTGARRAALTRPSAGAATDRSGRPAGRP
jgi:hypothetical protein